RQVSDTSASWTPPSARSHTDRRGGLLQNVILRNEMQAHAVSQPLPFKVRNSASSTRACYTGSAHMWSALRISLGTEPSTVRAERNGSGREGALQTDAHS